MIIAHLIGGLGNQMFQYAASRALSLERDLPLYLDVQDFEGYSLHNGYELNRVFNINTQIAGKVELKEEKHLLADQIKKQTNRTKESMLANKH